MFACSSQKPLKLATTTSTENSGLLTYLLPVFQADTGIEVSVIAVGTGKAIKMGENGDVDVILVHARSAEDKFVNEGFGINRRDVMHNDFVIIGPENDPANIRKAGSIAEVFQNISRSEINFISRGDNSGTNKKEKILWNIAEVIPNGKWYKEIGQGMGKTLLMVSEFGAYTISDRGTYIALADKISLPILFENNSKLSNPYGVIAVNPLKHSFVNHQDANKFIEWLTSTKAQKLINDFRINGKQLFHADNLIDE